MNVEDMLRDALKTDEGAWPAEEWPAFRKRARAATIRQRITGAAGVALVAAIVIAVATVATHPGASRSFVTPTSERYMDAVGGFELRIPQGWIVTSARRGVDVVLQEEHPVAGAKPAEFNILVDAGRSWADVVQRHHDELWPGARVNGSTVTEGGTARIADHGAAVTDVQFADSPPEGVEPKDWCLGCRGRQYLVDWDARTVLRIVQNAPDAASYERAGEVFAAIVDSIGVVENVERYVPAGTAAATIDPTDALRALMHFLDARARGEGAADFLARRDVADDSKLYEPGGARATGYFITMVEPASDHPRYTLCMSGADATWRDRETVDMKFDGTIKVIALHVEETEPTACFT